MRVQRHHLVKWLEMACAALEFWSDVQNYKDQYEHQCHVVAVTCFMNRLLLNTTGKKIVFFGEESKI